MASSCDRCRRLGFPSELNRYPDAESRKRHGLLHLDVDLGVDGGAAKELMDKMEEDCFSSENQQETSQTSEKIRCPKCPFSAQMEKQLIQHLLGVHLQRRQNRCDICGYISKNCHTLAAHFISHISQHPHKCGHCGKTFKREYHFNEHLKIHSEKRENRPKMNEQVEKLKTANGSCATCGKDFQFRRALLQHQKWLHERPEACELCGLRFHTQKALNHHRTDKHPDGQKTHLPYEFVVLGKGEEAWRCLQCGFLDSSAALADAHQLKHSPDTKKFQSESDTGSKKFLMLCCIKCDFCAPTESLLIAHLRLVHLKGRRNKCDLCEMSFTYSGHLADHLLSHSSYHPFKCACALTFKRNRDYRQHIISCAQTSEKNCNVNFPLPEKTMLNKQTCPLCKYSADKRQLLHHIRVVHLRNQKKNCDFCRNTYIGPNQLARHLFFHHRPFSSKPQKASEGLRTFVGTRSCFKRKIHRDQVGNSQNKYKSQLPRFSSYIGLYEAVKRPEPGWRCKSCHMHFKSRTGDFYSHLRRHQIQPGSQRLQHFEKGSNHEEAELPEGESGSLDVGVARKESGEEDLQSSGQQTLSEGVFVSSEMEQEAMSRSQPSPSISLPSVGEARETEADSKAILDLLSIPGLGIRECWKRAKELFKSPVEKEGSELVVTDPLAAGVFRVQLEASSCSDHRRGIFLICEKSCPDFHLKYHRLFCCHTLAAAKSIKRLHKLLRAIWEEIQKRQC